MKRGMLIAGAVAVAGLLGLRAMMGEPLIDPLPASRVEVSKEIDGVTFILIDSGELYRVDPRSRKWIYHDTVFHPAEMEASFEEIDGVTHRVDRGANIRAPVRRQFREDFEGLSEGADGLRGMIGLQRGWGSLTLQTPKAPTVKDYVELRKRILGGKSDFLDAIVAPSRKRVFGGEMALECFCPPRPANMVTCKASLSSPLMYFKDGDDFWFRGRFFAEGARPLTIMDLECEWIEQHAGIRLMIDEDNRLCAELKALEKPMYRQPAGQAVEFPLDRWVEVTACFHLSNFAEEGRVRIWQDGELVVDAMGMTLPLRRAIYSSLEIGISAHSRGAKAARLFVDDIEVSDAPMAIKGLAPN